MNALGHVQMDIGLNNHKLALVDEHQCTEVNRDFPHEQQYEDEHNYELDELDNVSIEWQPSKKISMIQSKIALNEVNLEMGNKIFKSIDQFK